MFPLLLLEHPEASRNGKKFTLCGEYGACRTPLVVKSRARFHRRSQHEGEDSEHREASRQRLQVTFRACPCTRSTTDPRNTVLSDEFLDGSFIVSV